MNETRLTHTLGSRHRSRAVARSPHEQHGYEVRGNRPDSPPTAASAGPSRRVARPLQIAGVVASTAASVSCCRGALCPCKAATYRLVRVVQVTRMLWLRLAAKEGSQHLRREVLLVASRRHALQPSKSASQPHSQSNQPATRTGPGTYPHPRHAHVTRVEPDSCPEVAHREAPRRRHQDVIVLDVQVARSVRVEMHSSLVPVNTRRTC